MNELILCSNCRRPYPDAGLPYRCPTCGSVFNWERLPAYDPAAVQPASPGLWRYRSSFSLPETTPLVYLGEGLTPLVPGQVEGRPVAFKLEFTNPTGSFKDRGSAVLASFLLSRGARAAVEDSSGNAGASFAAYATHAGLSARIFVPAYASGPKRRQIEAYGAEIAAIPGTRADTSTAVRAAAEAGAVYASHAYLPQGIAGYATIAYELVEQMGRTPGTVVAPAGQGNLLLALGLGFEALQAGGVVPAVPKLIGVQARACAPLWAVFEYGAGGLMWVSEGETLAEGVRIRYPVRGDAVLKAVRDSGGFFIAADEEEILPGRDALARQGLYVEPTSAIVYGAIVQAGDQAPDPVVAVLTGSGLKSS